MTKNYYYDGDRLIAEKWSTGAYLLYHYDETGSPYAITYSATGGGYAKYYLIKNLQGDVLQIRNVNNVVVANYEYDAWGKVVSIKYANGNDINVSNHIGVINPIRYRGYYYDSETGYYYLQTRYYNPEWGRFINADGYINANGDILGYNMFAYCSNNPVNNVDPTGEAIAISTIILGVAALYLLTCAAVELANDFSRSIAEAPPTIPDILVRPANPIFEVGVDEIPKIFEEKEKYDPNPYKRPGEKKQNRENRHKGRQKDDWEPRNNRRSGKPAKPKKHTPGREHRKFYFVSPKSLEI